MSLKIGPHSNNAPLGSEDAGIIRTIPPKKTSLLYSGPIGASKTFTSPWYDTLGDGTAAVSITAFSTTSTISSVRIIQTDDTGVAQASVSFFSNAISVQAAANTQAIASQFNANTQSTTKAVISARYWCVQVVATVTAGNIVVTGTTSTAGNIVEGPINWGVSFPGLLGTAPLIAACQDGQTAYTQAVASSVAVAGIPEVLSAFVTTGSSTNTAMARTPAIFKGGQGGASAGAFNIWQPQLTKKVRAMKYMIEIAEDATITSGPLPINIGFRFGLQNNLTATPGSFTRSNIFDYTHRSVIPAAVLATAFDGYQTPWIDLGNGIIAPSAGQSLFCGLQVPAATSAVTPTWTLATTGQWEAGCVAFTTLNNKGAFRLVQSYSASGVASATGVVAVGNGRGNLVVVITRTTNIAGGVPTVTVSDTAVNSWTNLTAINNATDTANGSSIQVSYCLNMVGSDANLGTNIITSTTSVHLATVTQIVILEYENMGGAIDASAQTTGTGNSTAPAAGAYSPTTAGDLILSYAASGTSQATCPLMATAGFFASMAVGTISTPALAVADNWGNGVLAAGLVDVVVVGTEE